MAAKKTVAETDDEIRSRISQAVAMDPDLDGVDLRVFLYLSARLSFVEYIYQPQLELSVALGRRKEHISRSVRHLIDAGILVAGPKGTRASEWRLNPDYGK